MRSAGYFVEGLIELGELQDAATRRAAFRQSIVTLVQAAQLDGPGPLEGLHPDALVPGVRAALEHGLVDDLTWLSPEAAGVGLYEIAAALPAGAEKRELGRRVAAYTYDGNADTFSAIATRMALGSGKGLSSGPVRARVTLSLELPAGASARVQSLALALASRRELCREWIVRPSTGSLPSRRLSARLIERAATEAARRADQGDDHPLRVFRSEALGAAFRDLLADRESLVWRHAAIARGALASVMPELAHAIEQNLSPRLTPTEWRRAATSLGASLGGDASRVVKRVRELADSELVKRDPGVLGCLIFGLAHGARIEPEAGADLALLVVEKQGIAVAEAFEEATRLERAWLTNRASEALRKKLLQELAREGAITDDGVAALAEEVARDLHPERVDRPVRVAVAEALATFATRGAKAALERAHEALALARDAVTQLEVAASAAPSEQRRNFARLRDLDVGLLESAVLPNLLALDRRSADASHATPAVEELNERIARVLIAREGEAQDENELTLHPTIPLRRLRTLLHVLDADRDLDEAGEHAGQSVAIRTRWLGACRMLLDRLTLDPPALLERTLSAALARALDGLLRTEVCDVVDLSLILACRLGGANQWATLAEASTHPDLVLALRRHHSLLVSLVSASGPAERSPVSSWPPPSSGLTPRPDPLSLKLGAFRAFAEETAAEGSPREEALRTVLVRLSRALDIVSKATCLDDLTVEGAAPSPLAALEAAVLSLAQLVATARRKMGEESDDAAPRSVLAAGKKDDLARLVGRAANAEHPHVAAVLRHFLHTWSDALPTAVVGLLAGTLDKVVGLPVEGTGPRSLSPSTDGKLPAWLPSRRILGAFFVLRPIGAGAVGSVFVVKRVEERADPAAERFALKVPDYDPVVARHLSEPEFLQLFRNEASALLGLPSHPNLARFVTFDLSARPKPILVMELVEGATLEHLIDGGRMTTKRASAILDGVLSGIEAMHAAGIGHLDVKPSNVILRNDAEPVLVDFGLAGRHIRPGCGTPCYQAPEVWGVPGTPSAPLPMPADVYSAACLAYETFSGRQLFDQESEMALVSAHVGHDGWPEPLQGWKEAPPLKRLADLLAQALRRDPETRLTVPAFREALRAIAPGLGQLTWPLAV